MSDSSSTTRFGERRKKVERERGKVQKLIIFLKYVFLEKVKKEDLVIDLEAS